MAGFIQIRGGGQLKAPATSTGKIRKENGYLYSAYLLPTALAKGDYDVFTVGQGSEGQGWGSGNTLTERETNLANSARIPDEQSFALTEIGFHLDSNTSAIADVRAVQRLSTLVFERPGYVRILGPAQMFPGGFGLSGITTQNAAEQWTNGLPSVNARRRLSNPILLDPGTSFKVHIRVTAANFSAPTLGATVGVWVSFWGTRFEAVAQQ